MQSKKQSILKMTRYIILSASGMFLCIFALILSFIPSLFGSPEGFHAFFWLLFFGGDIASLGTVLAFVLKGDFSSMESRSKKEMPSGTNPKNSKVETEPIKTEGVNKTIKNESEMMESITEQTKA